MTAKCPDDSKYIFRFSNISMELQKVNPMPQKHIDAMYSDPVIVLAKTTSSLEQR